MKANTIRLRPDRLDDPLATCVVGKLSSAVFRIIGDIPEDVDSMAVLIERLPDPSTHAVRANITVAASADERGGFRAYFAPWCFPDATEELDYHVVMTDKAGNARWLGTGDLRIKDNPANGTAEAPEIIPQDTYIRNPATGLYHLLTAVANSDGEITFNLAPEGIQR